MEKLIGKKINPIHILFITRVNNSNWKKTKPDKGLLNEVRIMFRFLKRFTFPHAKLGRIPTKFDMVTYKDCKNWSI